MEEKKVKQEIDINKFVNFMEHPTNEAVKKEIELGLKSNYIPDETKNQIKSKFFDIQDNKRDLGEEYDRYLVNLLTKKRKEFKYLQAIFLIINNMEKHKILKKEGIIPDEKNEEGNNDIELDNDWYIDIKIDLVFNDNNYYHKYIKKMVNEFFVLLRKDFLTNYIKLDFIKKGESYYKNNKEEFLSSVIQLFEKLNNLTKDVDKNEPKRKKKKKKNKNKSVNSNNDSEIKEIENNIINGKEEDKLNNDDNLDDNQNIIDNFNNNLNEKKEEKENEIKNDNDEKKEESIKNKLWLDNLKLNREELKLVNNLNDKPLKSEINFLNKKEVENNLDTSKLDIEKRFKHLENQINELKNKNKIQENQISHFQEEISKLKLENENLKKEFQNNNFSNKFLLKQANKFILKKIIEKYFDKIKAKKEGENIKLNFIEDISGIKVNDLNKFIEKLFLDSISTEENYENIIFSLISKDEIKEFKLFEENNKIINYIIDKFNLK